MPKIEYIRKVVADIAAQYQIKRVSLFNFYAEGRQTEASAIGFLVEFQDDAVSLFTLSALKIELEEQLGLSVNVFHAPLPQDSGIKPSNVLLIYE